MAQPTTMTETERQCARCNKPAQSMCAACKDGLDIHGKPSPISYCSKECQSTHWKEHKSDCKGSNHRKQLYRAGEVARKIFFDMRYLDFDIKIEKAVKKNGRISLQPGQCGDDEVLIGLPKGMFESQEDEESMLAYGADSKGLSITHKFATSALEGCYKMTCEVNMFGAAGKVRVGYPKPDKAPRGHTTFRVELKDGNTYAMDLTIAQFGIRQVVMPWEEYCTVLDLKGACYFPLGKSELNDLKLHATYQANLTPGRPLDLYGEEYSYRNVIMIVQGSMTSCVYSAANAWMAKYDQNAPKMITLSKPQYEKDFEEFTSFVKHHIASFVTWINVHGFKKVINTFKSVFEGYVEERVKYARAEAQKDEPVSNLVWKAMIEEDRFPEVEKAFRKLQGETDDEDELKKAKEKEEPKFHMAHIANGKGLVIWGDE